MRFAYPRYGGLCRFRRSSRSLKISTAALALEWSAVRAPTGGREAETIMSEKTCAVCDYALDGNAIEVTIGGRTVEVCCEECAQKLREATASQQQR